MGDLRFAIRQLIKNPGFAAVAILTLALGIGATTAIFSVIYGVLISPYPYANPDKIWTPGLQNADGQQLIRRYRRDEFEALVALPAIAESMGTAPGSTLLTGEFGPETITTPRLTSEAFQFLGVAPVIGRTFGPGDFSSPAQPEPVAVISYPLWQRLFGGDAKALGRTLRLDDRLYTVIGVMPPRFGWWTSDGVWLPLAKASGDQGRLFPIVRLKPGVASGVALQQWQALQPELAKQNPGDFPKGNFESLLTNYLDITAASGEMQRTLNLLMAAVGFLLLIACANVANLQMARATGRAREMAVRLSIGAGRGRLVRQLLTESLLLSGLGALLGLAFAVMITRLMVILMPSFYIPNEARIGINGWVLLFSLAISTVTGIAFGLVPALQGTRQDLAATLKEEARSVGGARRGWFRPGLVVTEVALSVVLLVGAALTMRSFMELQHVEPGFRTEQLMTFDVTLPRTRYDTFFKRNQFSEALLERVQKLPGVESAQIGNGGTPFGSPSTKYSIAGQPGEDSRPLLLSLVSADYLKTMGIALKKGRALARDEVRRADRVAIINEAAAALWPAGEDPLGKTIKADLLGGGPGAVFFPTNASPDVTVVGICADIRNDGLTSETRPTIFVPYTLVAPPGRTLAVHVRGDIESFVKAVRSEVRAMDPLLPVQNPRTIDQVMADQTVQPRFTMVLFGLFAVVGLALATIGLFSLLSYLVAQRTREIGVRMALGARRSDVLGLIFKDGGGLAGLGLVVGTIGSLGAARFVGSQIDLFHVTATDPIAFAAVIVLLGAVASVACWLPARKASRVDPMVALRTE